MKNEKITEAKEPSIVSLSIPFEVVVRQFPNNPVGDAKQRIRFAADFIGTLSQSLFEKGLSFDSTEFDSREAEFDALMDFREQVISSARMINAFTSGIWNFLDEIPREDTEESPKSLKLAA